MITRSRLLVALVILTMVLAGCSYQYHGAVLDPPKPIADFSLPAHTGDTFQLSDYRGQVVLVYFGYTYCPDVCPTTLYQVQRAMAELGSRADDVQVVMITVDPERDTLAQLEKYVTNFDPSFIGLRSADPGDLDPILADFGAYYEIADMSGESETGYLVNHTASVFVLNREGQMRALFSYGTSGEEMADDLKHLLKE